MAQSFPDYQPEGSASVMRIMGWNILPPVTLQLLLLSGCHGGGGEPVEEREPDDGGSGELVDVQRPDTAPTVRTDWGRDILSTDLTLNLETWTGNAKIVLAGGSSGAASLEKGDLKIGAVSDSAGPLSYKVERQRLDIGIRDNGDPVEISITYTFFLHPGFDGYGGQVHGLTILWPYFCGNLFPCHSDPADGLTFRFAVEGIPPGKTAVYPTAIPANAPSYMIALAVDDYSYHKLGVTDAGTEIGMWTLPGDEDAATAGTRNLVAMFDWFEHNVGPYPFGNKAGSVSAAWLVPMFSALEHHPYWHVHRTYFGDENLQAHEAAHGWFGNGVRIRCWEDLTLSEGVATYLTARAVEAVVGAEAGETIWRDYDVALNMVIDGRDTEAWPEGCGEIDILRHPLLGTVPYVKGAYFLRTVEEATSRQEVDHALSTFFAEWVGRAAGLQDLLNTIVAETSLTQAHVDKIADGWLRSLGRPDK